MRIFSQLYRRAMAWSRHRHTPRCLGGLSFAESSFFPIPPDMMLAPMRRANPTRAWHFALITALASVAGGLFDHAIGHFAFDAVEPWLRASQYWDNCQAAAGWFARWGFWVVFIADFSPIPYKAFTLAAGPMSMALIPLALALLIGRGARLFLVAALISGAARALKRRCTAMSTAWAGRPWHWRRRC